MFSCIGFIYNKFIFCAYINGTHTHIFLFLILTPELGKESFQDNQTPFMRSMRYKWSLVCYAKVNSLLKCRSELTSTELFSGELIIFMAYLDFSACTWNCLEYALSDKRSIVGSPIPRQTPPNFVDIMELTNFKCIFSIGKISRCSDTKPWIKALNSPSFQLNSTHFLTQQHHFSRALIPYFF